MAKKNKQFEQYKAGRTQGLDIALRVLRDAGDIDGARLIHEEIKARGGLQINTVLNMRELEEATEEMRDFLNDAHILLWLYTLCDEFGFGCKRLNRAMDAFVRINSRVQNGEIGYHDYLQIINIKLQKVLDDKHLKKDQHYEKPEGEDKYDHTGKPA